MHISGVQVKLRKLQPEETGSGPATSSMVDHVNLLRFPQPWGYPNSWMVYFMKNPIKMDDLGVPSF